MFNQFKSIKKCEQKKYMLETLRPVLTLIFVDDDFIFKCNYSLITLINYKS